MHLGKIVAVLDCITFDGEAPVEQVPVLVPVATQPDGDDDGDTETADDAEFVAA